MQGFRWYVRCLYLSFIASVFDPKVTTFKAIEHVLHTQTCKKYSLKQKKSLFLGIWEYQQFHKLLVLLPMM